MKNPPSRLIIASVVIVLWSCVALSQSSNSQPLTEVPFAFDHTTVLIQVKLNGKGPFNMILDTGSDIAAINLDTAKELGLKLQPVKGPVTGGGADKPQAFATEIALAEIGSLISKHLEAVALDLSKQSQILGKPLHGVLGYSVLKNRVVQFDYPKRTIRFYAASPYAKASQTAKTERRVVLPFNLADESPIIDEVYVNGKQIKALIDTGGGGAYFALMPEAIASLGLEEEMAQAEPDNRSMGFNGTVTSRKGKIKTLRVGAINIESPTVIFYPKGVGKDHRKFGGAIGNPFLQDFVVTFDYPNKNVVLERP